jgi:hypothetical protein
MVEFSLLGMAVKNNLDVRIYSFTLKKYSNEKINLRNEHIAGFRNYSCRQAS